MNVLVHVGTTAHFEFLKPYLEVLDKNDCNLTYVLDRSIPFLPKIVDQVKNSNASYFVVKDGVYETWRAVRKVKDEIIDKKISHLVLCDDTNRSGPFIQRAAQKMNVFTVLVPFTITTPSKTLQWYYLNKINIVSKPSTKLVMQLFPSWFRTYKNQLFQKGSMKELVMLCLLRSYPKNPWIFFGGASNVIALESSFDYAYYEKNDLLNSKMKVIGNPIFDKIQDFKSENNDDDDRISITWACPPIGLDESVPIFKDGAQFISFMANTLLDTGADTKVSLHPRTPVATAQFLQEKGFMVAEQSVNELIMCSDIFIATVSATIRTSIILDVSTINFDIYNYNYGDYDNFEIVSTVSSRESFENQLNHEIARTKENSKDSQANSYSDQSSCTRFLQEFNLAN